MRNQPIGMFDSGVGGLKILAAARKLLRNENFIFVFDRSHAPYGNRSNRYVRCRAEKVTGLLTSAGAKAVVVACNTATNVGVGALRKKFGVPVIGVEPPLKPAALDSGGGKILLLCTPLTARQERFRALVRMWDNGNLIIAPQPELARLIENNFASLGDLRTQVDALLAPFDGESIESVVLGCTHYYFVADLIRAHYGGAVRIYDACDGVARRLASVLDERDLLSEHNIGKVKYIYI